MKKIAFLFLLLCGGGATISAQTGDSLTSLPKNMLALVQNSLFLTDAQEAYVELILYFDGKTLRYIPNQAGQYQAEIDVKITINQKDSIISAQHFILVSDPYADSLLANKKSFFDIRNMKIPNHNTYDIYYEIMDLHGNGKKLTLDDILSVDFPENHLCMSEMHLLSELTTENRGIYQKYGLTMTPLLAKYADKNQSILPFYLEIYNADKVMKTDNLTVRMYIEQAGNITSSTPDILSEKTYKTDPVILLVSKIDISALPSGNYNLVVEVLSEDMTPQLVQKAFFFRSNPVASVETTFVSKMVDIVELRANVASLIPIASRAEQDFFKQRLKLMTLEQLQRYFYAFWVKRNMNYPEREWLAYKAKVDYVQTQFGSKQVKGYLTDRGRIYLQYGPPSAIKDISFDPQTYPYQIWQYYVIDDEKNVKFVFWAPAAVSNDYELLHSTKRGELHDSLWQRKLTQKMDPMENFDDKKAIDYWGGHVNDEWILDF